MVENGVASEYTFRDATKEEREAVDNYIKTISIPTEVTADLSNVYKSTICTSCIICGESIDLDEYEERCAQFGKPIIKICDKCKAAVMKIRREME